MIQINILLVIFLAYMMLVLVFTFFNTYHMLKFGEASARTVTITVAYLLAVALMLGWSAMLIANADWSATISFSPFFPF